MSTGRDKFKRFSPIIMLMVKVLGLFPKSVLKWLLSVFQNTKGIKGIAIRYILVKCVCADCGTNVSIHPNVYLLHIDKLKLGSNISIHPMCYIDAEGEITIGDNVSIAHFTTILSSTHKYLDVDVPIKYQGMKLNRTIIDSNVWIGAKATILSGLEIKSGSIIAAGAVVTSNVENNSIVAGVPAKIIKSRGQKPLRCSK